MKSHVIEDPEKKEIEDDNEYDRICRSLELDLILEP